jgi:putative hydrolase of the HAD superfamily
VEWNRSWIFDLDNTLHDAAPHIFPHINRSMREHVQAQLGLEAEAAGALGRDYWARYGATLLGLMRHHGVNPRDFLMRTHQFTELDRLVIREPQLRSTLRRLPGRKSAFSNAPSHYIRAVLRALAIGELFNGMFSIERTRCRPKPDDHGFLRLVRAHHLRARRCTLVEDSLENLRTAKTLGLKTVWVSRERRTPASVDLKITNLMQLRLAWPRLA